MTSMTHETLRFYLLAILFLTGTAVSQPKPNILLILVDDMGYGDPRCFNPESKITPDDLVETTDKGPNSKFQLYKLRNDPGEAANVFSQEPGKAEELFTALKADLARGRSR